MTKPQTPPQWFADLNMPGHLRRQLLADFTIHVRGYMRWYRGAPRWVCGKNAPPAEVHDAWEQKRKAIDGDARAKIVRKRSGYSIREAAALYYAHLDHRVAHGQPKYLSPYSRADAVRFVNAFGKSAGPDKLLDELEPDDFTGFAKGFAGKAPSTLTRAVANVRAFFAWCVKEGLIGTMPAFGSYFARAPRQQHRDARIKQLKSYAAAEIRALWDKANTEERLWIGLGLNGALDNADLSNLTQDLIDHERGLLDYRRRKVGAARRIVPLRPEVIKLLDGYHRPEPADPAYSRLVFLTPEGHPLGRTRPSDKRPGMTTTIDAVAHRWRKLAVRAGLRQPPTLTQTGRGAARVQKVKYPADSDRRGFRSLRTTFGNLAPIGYGDERRVIMGHMDGGVFVENYLERFGIERLRELVDHVWESVFTSRRQKGASKSRGSAVGVRAAGGRIRAAAKPRRARSPSPAH